MVFWFIMFLTSLLVPGMMLGFGWWFRDHAPKKINCIWGYRTARSMKNKDTWDFAHKKLGEVWLRWGKWMLLTAAPMVFAIGKDEDVVGTVSCTLLLFQCALLLVSIAPVEKALRENFDEDGYQKNASL